MPDLGNWGQFGALTDKVEYGRHIDLYCVNHPDAKYSTKNIAPIGARSIFHIGGPDCACPGSDLRVSPIPVQVNATPKE